MKNMVKNLVHKVGKHCESSALRDVFEYTGFPMTEAMVFGLDATMGFAFFDSTSNFSFFESETPFFLGGKQGTIEANSLACRVMGINLRKQSFTSADKAWNEAKKLVDKDFPLILKIDMGYLPYFNFEDDFHFGGHTIVLAGYNEEEKISYIADTDFKNFQEVSVENLKKGRSSTHGAPFMRPKNTQFSMQKRFDGKHPPFAAGVKLAIQKVVNNMLRATTSNNGLQGLKQFAFSIPHWSEKLSGTFRDSSEGEESVARLMFEIMQGYIETWGTEGAAFRKLYKEFLEELLTHTELKEGPRAWSKEEFKILEDCIPIIDDSVHHWTLFAETLKNAADEYKNDCLNHVDFDELHNIALFIWSREEELFKKLSKIKI